MNAVEEAKLAQWIAQLKQRGVAEIRILCVDFDNTLTKEDKYPNVGEFREGALQVLTAFQKAGGKVLLWTCREGVWLDQALLVMKLWGFRPDWTNTQTWPALKDSRKPYFDVLIDDRALGCPLDWGFIGRLLTAMAPKDRNWFRAWKGGGGSS